MLSGNGRLELEGIYSLVYWFLCLCFIVPPKEVASAGVTVQNLFGSYLGDEMLDFIKYHTRRASLTLFIHSLFPLGYVLVLMYINVDYYLYYFLDLPPIIKIFYLSALSLPIASSTCIFIWSRHNWRYHPLTQKLKNLLPGERDGSPDAVASAINTELRRPNLFNTGHYSQKVHVTDNWIVKIGTYSIDIVHQSNCVLSLQSSQEFTLSEDSPHGVQMLHIDVRPVDKTQKPFGIRLNSVDYGELKSRLQAPLVNARDVVVRQTVAERFTEAFADVVSRNKKYQFNPTAFGFELESCLACLQQRANVKLVKCCTDTDEGECRQCYCRPLWCMDCLAKWFCARQNQTDTTQWLSGTAGCPMCRAVFCMADVCPVEIV